ncbi:MAG: LysR family transcriptional regulator [bacterium]
MLTSQDIYFFSVVARSASLAAAARTLDVTPSAVSQRLRQLEERVGVSLVSRTSRQITLTDEGQLLAERGGAINDELSDLAESLTARGGVVSGHLRVFAPLGFGRRYVAPAVSAFCAAHPDVTIELQLSDRLGRVPESAWDVAVHIGLLHDSSLIAHRLAANARCACASPEFLARHGRPTDPSQLRAFDCIALRENDEDVTLWRFADGAGQPAHVRIEPRLASNDGDVVRAWALESRGIIVRSEWSVMADLRAGRLVRVLGQYSLPSADIVALVASRQGRSARTSHFIRSLRKAMSPAPWRQRGRHQ